MKFNIKDIFSKADFDGIMYTDNIIIKNKMIDSDKYQYQLKHYFNDEDIWIVNYSAINGSDCGIKAFKGCYEDLSEVSGGTLEILTLLDSLL